MNEQNFDIIESVQKIFGYKFKDKNLIIRALTHPSCNSFDKVENNERLEFLGDAVLNLVLAEKLYLKYSNIREDKLSSLRAKLVSCDAICFVANKINFKDQIIMSFGEERNGGRENVRNVENAMEAVIGAIYIDGGIEAAKKVVLSHWQQLFNNINLLGIDSKTFLQEWSQKNKFGTPVYNVLNQTGPSHAPIFVMEVVVGNLGRITGEGQNKKESEKKAAENFIMEYIDDNEK